MGILYSASVFFGAQIDPKHQDEFYKVYEDFENDQVFDLVDTNTWGDGQYFICVKETWQSASQHDEKQLVVPLMSLINTRTPDWYVGKVAEIRQLASKYNWEIPNIDWFAITTIS